MGYPILRCNFAPFTSIVRPLLLTVFDSMQHAAVHAQRHEKRMNRNHSYMFSQ